MLSFWLPPPPTAYPLFLNYSKRTTTKKRTKRGHYRSKSQAWRRASWAVVVHSSRCVLHRVCHVDVVSSGSVGSLTQPPSHITALFITPPSCIGSPPSMHLEAPAHSPKPIAPTQSNGRKLLPLPSPLHSPPGRHLSSCSCSCSCSAQLLLLLFTQRRLAARARHTLWIITHTHMGVLRCTHACKHMHRYVLILFPGHLLWRSGNWFWHLHF